MELEGSLQLKSALRWHGSLDLSSILTADSKMDRCMLDGLTVKPTEVKGGYETDILLHAGVRLIGKYYKTFI